MNSTDIEETATIIIKNQVLRNKSCMKAHIDENDRTPLWDGGIWIYDSEEKKIDNFENKIDVQIKGRNVKELKKNNSYQIEIKYLKGYQKEIKGTLLFVVDYIDLDHYIIHYCNLLPVDLYEILKNTDENQKTVSLPLKVIDENSALNFKNVCINFYKNSNRQANKRIIDESEFNQIEELKFEIYTSQTEYEEYLEAADVYTYAKLKDTHEEVVTVKGKWKSFSSIKKDIIINKKKYYSEYRVVGKDQSELVVGPITIDFNNGRVHFELEGTPQKRIKDLEFIINLLKEQYIMFDNFKLDLPFNNQKLIEKNTDIYLKQLNYYKKITKLFKFFKTDFDIDYNSLTKNDIKNLNQMLSLYDGNFPKDLRELQRYYITINKYKFVFVIVYNGNKIYNFYSQEFIDNSLCVINRDGKEIRTFCYAGISPEEYLNVSNFDGNMIIKSFKNIEINEAVLDSMNLLMLSFLSSYDKTGDLKYLKLADKISVYICHYRNNDLDFINSRQIKCRKSTLSYQDKKILNEISEKEEYKNDYLTLCSIDILLNNEFNFSLHYKQMKKTDKKVFVEWPIYNLKDK